MNVCVSGPKFKKRKIITKLDNSRKQERNATYMADEGFER
jgi:hypothetical protein